MSPAITPRSRHSFTVSDVPALAEWLQARKYQPLNSRSLVEFGRYQSGASLIVLYHSGSVVCQGADVTSAQRLLAELITSPQPTLFDDEPGASYNIADDWTAREVLR